MGYAGIEPALTFYPVDIAYALAPTMRVSLMNKKVPKYDSWAWQESTLSKPFTPLRLCSRTGVVTNNYKPIMLSYILKAYVLADLRLLLQNIE